MDDGITFGQAALGALSALLVAVAAVLAWRRHERQRRARMEAEAGQDVYERLLERRAARARGAAR